MVSTRSRTRVDGRQSEVQRIGEKSFGWPDSEAPLKMRNKRKRLQNRPPEGDCAPSKKKGGLALEVSSIGDDTKSNAFERNSLLTGTTRRDVGTQKDDGPQRDFGVQTDRALGEAIVAHATGVKTPEIGNRCESAAGAGLSKIAHAALLDLRKYSKYRELLEEKRQVLHSKQLWKQRMLDQSARRQFPHLKSFEKRLEEFVPGTEQERLALQRWIRLGERMQDVREFSEGADLKIAASTTILLQFISSRYGHETPSEAGIIDRLDPLDQYDDSSDGADAAKDAGADDTQVLINKLVPGHTTTCPDQGPDDTSAYSREMQQDPAQSERQQKAASARRRTKARQQLAEEEATFDNFWRSYYGRKTDWRRQWQAGETSQTVTEFDLTDLLRGQEHTRELGKAEIAYRVAALNAKKDNVTYVSPNQTSIFPSSDGTDREEYDWEIGKSLTRASNGALSSWFQKDWDPELKLSPFDGHDAAPEDNRSSEAIALSQVPFGWGEETWATGRQRDHIEQWNKQRQEDWAHMLQRWSVTGNNSQGAPVSLPLDSPKPDPLNVIAPAAATEVEDRTIED